MARNLHLDSWDMEICAEPDFPIRPLTGRRLCCQRRTDCLNEYCQAVRHVASSTCVNCCLSPLTLNSSKLTSVGSAESRDASLAMNCGSGTVEAGSTSLWSPSSRTGERCHRQRSAVLLSWSRMSIRTRSQCGRTPGTCGSRNLALPPYVPHLVTAEIERW